MRLGLLFDIMDTQAPNIAFTFDFMANIALLRNYHGYLMIFGIN